MMEIQIKIEAPEIAEALNNLAQAITHSNCELTKHEDIKESADNGGKNYQDSSNEPTNKMKSSNADCTIEDVRAAFADYAKTKGKDAAKSILSQFGVAKVTSLKKSDYGNAIKMIQEG